MSNYFLSNLWTGLLQKNSVETVEFSRNAIFVLKQKILKPR